MNHYVKLVGSIMPTYIDVEKVSSEGPKLLKAYIDFAINGADVLARETTESDIVEHDSPFETAVYNFLDRKGYKLGTQVGCSGYRIDMAVKHPTLNGIYVLGIECDGAAYHSARTARERDRLRQEVLENMGWRIHRIWSTDWIKDCITEGNRLIAAVEDAIANYGVVETPIESNDGTDSNLDAFVSVNEKEFSDADKINPYGFEKTVHTSFSTLSHDRNGYVDIADCIMALVNDQYPLHYEPMCQRLASLFGNERASVSVRREVDYGLRKLGDKVIRKGDFLYPEGYKDIIIRVPNIRKVNYIAIEEFAEAMYKIVQQYIGINREGLCTETAKVYFGRSGKNIGIAMNEACDLLISQGRVNEVGGKLSIVDGALVSKQRSCHNCGTLLDKGDAFCGKCGNKAMEG